MSQPSYNQFFRHHATFLLVGCVALLLGITFGTSAFIQKAALEASESGEDSSMLGPPAPETMSELVDKAPIVVLGQVGPIVREDFFAGYDKDGKMIPVDTQLADAPSVGALPFVDHELQVERVLKDNGTIAAGQPLIIRLPGDRARGMKRYGDQLMPTTDDRYLFFLGPNPDNTTYGPYHGAWGLVVINTPIVTASDVKHTPMFNKNMTPTDFIRAVEGVIKNGR